MTEQKYRVVADRDKGDDPKNASMQEGDRLVYEVDSHGFYELVRIERLVPTTDEPMWFDRFGPNGGQWVGTPNAEQRAAALPLSSSTAEQFVSVYGAIDDLVVDKGAEVATEGVWAIRAALDAMIQASPHPPTREQIAEALWRNDDPARHNRDFTEADPLIRADHLEAADAVLALIQKESGR